MLKITSCLLFILLVASQAAKIEDIYGEWIQAGFYPSSPYIPLCVRFLFKKGAEDNNKQCTYSDGNNATLVQMSVISSDTVVLSGQAAMPVRIVDTYEEVNQVLNLTCKCGDKDIQEKAVARLANKDTVILYASRNSTEENAAFVFMKNPLPYVKLEALMNTIEDLKDRHGAVMCATENYGGFKSS